MNWIRVRIDSQELALNASSFNRRFIERAQPAWAYTFTFPKRFTDLKALFATVRSDIDGKPVDEALVPDGP